MNTQENPTQNQPTSEAIFKRVLNFIEIHCSWEGEPPIDLLTRFGFTPENMREKTILDFDVLYEQINDGGFSFLSFHSFMAFILGSTEQFEQEEEKRNDERDRKREEAMLRQMKSVLDIITPNIESTLASQGENAAIMKCAVYIASNCKIVTKGTDEARRMDMDAAVAEAIRLMKTIRNS